MSMPQAIAFARMANQKGLNWETRQIYPMKVKSGNGAETVVSMVSIDGFITLAERTGHYGGIINSRLRVRMKDGSKATIPVSEFDPDDVDEIISGTVEVVRKIGRIHKKQQRCSEVTLGWGMTEDHTASGKNYQKEWYSNALKVSLCVKPLPKTFPVFTLLKKWTKRETKYLRPCQGHVRLMELP